MPGGSGDGFGCDPVIIVVLLTVGSLLAAVLHATGVV